MAFGFIDFAKEVLEAMDRPLSVEEMWEAGCKLGLDERLASSGKTPVRTLSARLYVDLKNNPKSIFTQVSKRPAKFYLKGKDFTSDPEEIQETDGSRGTGRFHERDLHILLSSFVCADEHFKCMTKTIYHEVSKREKSGKNRWLIESIIQLFYYYGIVEFETKDIEEFYRKMQIFNPRSDGIRTPRSGQIQNALERIKAVRNVTENQYKILNVNSDIYELCIKEGYAKNAIM